MYADMMDTIGFVSKYDEEVGKAMNLELARQQRNIELIASENIVSPAVLSAFLQPSTPRATPASATTVAARMLI